MEGLKDSFTSIIQVFKLFSTKVNGYQNCFENCINIKSRNYLLLSIGMRVKYTVLLQVHNNIFT